MFRGLSTPARFLIQTNMLVSLAAVFLTLQTQVQLGMKPQLYPYLFIIFSASFLAYNIQSVVAMVGGQHRTTDIVQKQEIQNRRLQQILLIISIAVFFGAIVLAKQKIIATLIPLSILTLCYSFPLFKTKRAFFRLREVPFLKIFLISLIWSLVTVLLPTLHASEDVNREQLVLMLGERFLLIFAIAIPFDVRDMKTDEIEKLKTIPLVIGKTKAVALANTSMLTFMLISIVHFSFNLSFVLPALIISVVVMMVLINSKAWVTSPMYYSLLDATMILQGSLVCLCYYLNSWIA
jgi:4-hydroxybenzoate polyprenyltransferase